jgi:hypothetical protein
MLLKICTVYASGFDNFIIYPSFEHIKIQSFIQKIFNFSIRHLQIK